MPWGAPPRVYPGCLGNHFRSSEMIRSLNSVLSQTTGRNKPQSVKVLQTEPRRGPGMAAHLTDSSLLLLYSAPQIFVRRAPCHTGIGVCRGQRGTGGRTEERRAPGKTDFVSAPGSSQGKSACYLSCATVHKTASCILHF